MNSINERGVIMRVVFVYTDGNSPAVSSLKNVVSLEEITESDVEKIQATTSSSQVVKFVKSQGQLAVLWE